jgi:hypothetical protein
MRIRAVPNEGTHVELYVRTLSPTDARDSQESLLETLQQSAAVDSIEVVVTGDRICPETVAAGTEIGSALLEKFEQFEQWASETGRTLAPAFRRETGRSLLTGESVSGACFPDRALAEYRNGSLSFVAPCCNDGTAAADSREDERTWSVPDRVDELALDVNAEEGAPDNQHA